MKRFLLKNKVVLRDGHSLALSEKNKVNLNAWIVPDRINNNIGDYLSEIIVDEMVRFYGKDRNKVVSNTKHLYAIGSILMGWQDATVWGGGFGYNYSPSRYFAIYSFLHRHYHKTDIRAVRGPETYKILKKMGIECPQVYGDPAVLLPLFYEKKLSQKLEYLVIPHYSKDEKYHGKNVLHTFTTDYKKFVDKLCEAQLVVSSSLHGIILAESYGIPAIMLGDTPSDDITKYKDWYYSTGRDKFPIANSVEEALVLRPRILERKVITEMQERLINTFPIDLWE